MKIIVKAKTNSKEEKVERISQPSLGFEDTKSELVVYKVKVKEPPVDGKANTAIIKALAKYFDIAPSRVSLVSGQSSKQKVFEIVE
ncbi:MAG: DUF167 domain-containing protein [Candidatus Paceibacterota bacterium]